MDNIVDHLCSYRVLICAGTGGVGKTSTAAALGILAAQKGLNTLVLTIDPAKRLKTALGLDELSDHQSMVEIPGDASRKAKLYAAVVNAKQVFDDFVREASPTAEAAEVLLGNLLYRKLSMGLQGSQEFTSLQCFYAAYQSKKFDLIIVDTPPAQHAIDFLQAPSRLAKLFDERILRWFVAEKQAKPSLLRRAIQSGTRKAFSVLEKLTGDEFVEEIFNFFLSMKYIRASLVERNQQIDRLLHSERVGFVLITAYDAKKLAQATEFFQYLRQLDFHFAAVLVNRSFPAAEQVRIDTAAKAQRDYFFELQNYYEKEEEGLELLRKRFSEDVPVHKIFEVTSSTEPLQTVEEIARQFPWR